jgi:Ser/Thr protein kinase RdoA (MazF antagonist)
MRALLRSEYGLDAADLKPMTGGRVNHLWRCGDRVVKVYNHRLVPRERAERAIQVQTQVAAAGLPAPGPVPTRSGSRWVPSDEGLVVVMPLLPGARRVRGSLGEREAASLGAMLGRLHTVLGRLPLEQGNPPRVPSPEVAQERWVGLRGQALSVAKPTEFDRLVAEAAEYAVAALRRVPPPDWDSLPWQLCHGDMHLDNVLFDDEGNLVGLLDFDNAAPSWPGVELLMAWNLCFCSDPGRPTVTPESTVFFAAYKQAGGPAFDLGAALRAYWYTLTTNTWPAPLRYREGIVKPEWVELLTMRYRSARWLETNM